ncbi:MAG: metal-dependent hydrolase, partial [Vicinamibacterales bacterium]
ACGLTRLHASAYGGGMPSPVGHALGGLIVGLVGGRESGVGSRSVLLAATAAAVLPDVDFLWSRHSMETHSLGAAVLAGLVVLAWSRGRAPRLALVIALAWASHVLFDWLGSDDTPPLGVMALWPLTSEFYFAHAYVFEAISRRTWLPNFWTHNIAAVSWELLILGPLAVLAAWWRRARGRAAH